ncbi:MAG: ABC transporter substrate-binding protein [Myxococcales bacterium]
MSKQHNEIDTLWYTRCAGNGRGGVPTATGIAHQLGWIQEEFKSDGFRLRTLQDDDAVDVAYNHYDHDLTTLIREGGNLYSIPAKAQGAKTKLIGLTWIDEAQSILVRPDSEIRTPQQLKGKRLALPAFRDEDIRENKRGRSLARVQSLHGYHGALKSVGLTFDDVKLVEVGNENDARSGDIRRTEGVFWPGFSPLLEGKVDALYVKGANAQDIARRLGVKVGIDLDKLPEKRFRVNNGTPRPITVSDYLLENHFDVVVRFLAVTLRAAEWGKTHQQEVYDLLGKEIGASPEGLRAAYREDFHLSLAPDLRRSASSSSDRRRIGCSSTASSTATSTMTRGSTAARSRPRSACSRRARQLERTGPEQELQGALD